MATQPEGMKVYVHGHNFREDLWYCIDLYDEIVSLSLVAKIEYQKQGGWALMGDHIYWAGGINVEALRQRGRISIASMDLLRHNISDHGNPCSWEIVSASKKLPRHSPHVFALNNNIYVMGGYSNIYTRQVGHDYEYDDDERLRHCGEVYNIDTHTWDLIAFNVEDYASFSFNKTTTLVKTNEEIAALTYSLQMGHFLFYYVGMDDFIIQDHKTSFCLGPQSLNNPKDYYQHRRHGILRETMMSVRPVVRDSTLYWFTYDLYMYGYNFVQKQWFCSEEPLKGEKENEEFWSLTQSKDHFFDSPGSPILVDLYDYDASFLVIVPTTKGGKLAVAFLAVSKCTRTFSLTVSLKSSHTLSLTSDDPYFYPTDAMAM